MDDDPSARAQELEQALDWEKAEAAWLCARESGCPDANDGLARVRGSVARIRKLSRITEEILDEEDLEGAIEPFWELSGLMPSGDPTVRALRRRWREIRAKAAKRARRVMFVHYLCFMCVATAASFAYQSPPKSELAVLAGGTVTLALWIVFWLLIPAIRWKRPPPRHLIAPVRQRTERKQVEFPEGRSEESEGGGRYGVLRSRRMSRIERWRRDAERDRMRGDGL